MTPIASRCLAAAAAAVLITALPGAVAAQSLADVARGEQARRKEQPAATKVYTNDSVKTDITPSAPAPEGGAPAEPAAADAAAPAEAPAAGGEARDQKYWKSRMTGAREQLERSKTFAEALQTRVNALSADFVNRDDPAQQAQIAQNRTKAVAELDRVQREIAAHTKAIAAIEDEARKAGVPPGWLR